MLCKPFRIAIVLLCCFFNQAQAQLSNSLYKALPDSLKPKNRNALSIKEASDLLNKSAFFDAKYDEAFRLAAIGLKEKLGKTNKKREKILGFYSLAIYDFNQVKQPAVVHESLNQVFSLIGNNPSGYEKEIFNSLIVSASLFLQEQNFNYEKAINAVNSALKLKNRLKDKRVVPNAYKVLANIYRKLNLPDSSISNLKKADDFSIKTSEHYLKFDQHYIKITIATSYLIKYFESGNPVELKEAISFLTSVDRSKLNGKLLSEYLETQAYISYAQKNYKRTLAYANEALAVNFNAKDANVNKLRKTAIKGLALIKLNKNRKGLSLLIASQKKPELYFYSTLILQELYKTYERLGDYKNANFWLMNYIDYEKKVNLIKYRGVVLFANEKFLSAEKENTIEGLKQEAKFKKRQNEFIIFGGLGLIILILIFFFYRFRVNKIQEKSKEILYAQKILLMNEQIMQQDIKIKAECIEAALSERITIGKNLHDNLSGSLIALKYLVNDKRKKSTSDRELSTLNIIEEEIDSIYTETRNFSHLLSKSPVEEKDFIYDINTYLAKIKNRFKDLNLIELITDYDESLIETMLSPKLSENIYYFIKECLSNIIKHSEASKAFINIKFDLKNCIVNVSDNGKGFGELNNSDGIGLKNYISRVENLGGKIFIKSNKNGTNLTALIPLADSKTLRLKA